MASIIPNPDNVPLPGVGGVSTGYVRQNTLLFAGNTGYMNAGLTNFDNDSAPQVMRGSVIEVNGALYKVDVNQDESISGAVPSQVGDHFIYAVPAGNNLSFIYATPASKPATFNAAKGGWYNGNDRALWTFYLKASGQYHSKTVIESKQPLALPWKGDITTGGTTVSGGSVTAGNTKTLTLQRGWYLVTMKGGTGGTGGGNRYDSSNGAVGNDGTSVSRAFFVNGPTLVTIHAGKCGGDGARGGTSSNGGRRGQGGKAGMGGKSFLFAVGLYIEAAPGEGGNGNYGTGSSFYQDGLGNNASDGGVNSTTDTAFNGSVRNSFDPEDGATYGSGGGAAASDSGTSYGNNGSAPTNAGNSFVTIYKL